MEIPDEFFERITEIVGPSLFDSIRNTFIERPTTFRVNTLKVGSASFRATPGKLGGFKLRQVSWCKDAFVLLNKSKRELTETEEYKEGKIYMQSLASMVPPLILDPQPGDKVLDLAAAPGSKTSQIAAIMEKKGELVANDVNKVRFFKLKANMENLGVAKEKDNWNFTLRLEDGSVLCKEYIEPYFDKILVDAVCSSESRFVEGNPKTYGFWKPAKIKKMAYQQQRLLLSAWSVLKPGGTLVYSTCTWAPEENESRISKLIERNDDVEVLEIKVPGLKRLPVVKEWKGREYRKEVINTYRILPTNEIEGFFMAKLRKKGCIQS